MACSSVGPKPAFEIFVLTDTNLYPLRFEPIYQYRLWGGRNFDSLLSEPLPGNGPIGEAWAFR
jgi:hypothetical protein